MVALMGDLSQHMRAVATHLLGAPNAALSKYTELRFGTHGSLSVDLTRGTFYDHENNFGGGVLALVEQQVGRKGAEAVSWLHDELGIETNDGNRRKIVAAYDYRDEHGDLLFQVVRYEPKGFRQRKPDGAGGWEWSTKGVLQVPYQLRELLDANDCTIFVVEGEKAADALRERGLVATCSQGGAGKWKSEYAGYFSGADLVILPDDDERGHTHADHVARSLTGTAAHVRVVQLPGLPPKGDAYDWIEDGGTIENLDRLVTETAEFTTVEPEPPNADAKASLNEWDAGDDDEAIPPRGWLLGNVFCRRFVSSILADGGSGKTALRIAQALALASGRPITGEQVFQRARVLIISLEDDKDELRRRVRAACLHHGISQDMVRGWLFLAAPDAAAGRLMVPDEAGRAKPSTLVESLDAAITHREIDAVIIDPFVKSHAVDENNNAAMDAVVQLLANVAAKRNVVIDVPHHTSKGLNTPGNADSGRGASAMKDAARLVYTLTRMTPEEAKTYGIVEKDRRRLIRMDSAKVNIAPSAQAKWFRLVGVQLRNGTKLYPYGDEVQTVETWTPHDAWADLSGHLLNRILDDIDAGLPDGNRYTDAPRATDRAAWHIVTKHAPSKTEADARRIIKTWVKNGVLTAETYENPATRKDVKGLRVENAKRPT